MAIYILRNGEPQGPYEESVVAGWLKAGTCSAQDLAWRHGMAGWQPLGTIPLRKTKGLGGVGIVVALGGVLILGAISLFVIVVGFWLARKPTNFNSSINNRPVVNRSTNFNSPVANRTGVNRSQSNEGYRGGGGGRADTTPDFLLQGWMWPIAENSVSTYDFTQAQAAGRRTVEIRHWQRIGTLGWQSNQIYTADFTADEDEISLSSDTGYSEQWRIAERHPDHIVVQDKRGGTSVTWFNCAAGGWPDLIRASTRGCR